MYDKAGARHRVVKAGEGIFTHELQGTGDLQGGWAEAPMDTNTAVLGLEDYERVCAEGVGRVVKVLKKTPSSRNRADVDFLMVRGRS